MTWLRIDENTYIDDTLVTCAEYQLFIDEMRAQGKYYQPDHWTSSQFPKGQAKKPVLGIRYTDAVAFCEWLSEHENGKWHYRVPAPFEIMDFPLTTVKEISFGYWTSINNLLPSISFSLLNNKDKKVERFKYKSIGVLLPAPPAHTPSAGKSGDLLHKQKLSGIAKAEDIYYLSKLDNQIGIRLDEAVRIQAMTQLIEADLFNSLNPRSYQDRNSAKLLAVIVAQLSNANSVNSLKRSLALDRQSVIDINVSMEIASELALSANYVREFISDNDINIVLINNVIYLFRVMKDLVEVYNRRNGSSQPIEGIRVVRSENLHS